MGQIRIATRSSKLAMTQSGHVKDMIKSICPNADISFVEISTKGDLDKSDFLYKSNSVGFFTSEVENALLRDKADIAVHSLKDLPTEITGGLTIAAIPPREQVSDVIVTGKNINSINDLPHGASIGTSSLRRIAQIKHLRNDLNCLPLRGNVETRVNKVKSGEYDAIIIAQAGLNRLEMADCISLVLAPEKFLPAAGQGALAIQTRSDDGELMDLLSEIDDYPTRVTTGMERAVLSKLHGGCSIPLGIHTKLHADIISLTAVISNTDATKYIRKTARCKVFESEKTAEKIASEIYRDGGKEILNEIRG